MEFNGNAKPAVKILYCLDNIWAAPFINCTPQLGLGHCSHEAQPKEDRPLGLKLVRRAMEIKTELAPHLADLRVQAETRFRGKMNCERRGQRPQTKMRSTGLNG